MEKIEYKEYENKTSVAILMATYNGEKYLREQIDSILSQTYTDWHLYIHDDGSTDNTKQILSDYCEYQNRITLLRYDKQGGACRNFISMLEIVNSEYYMFCDQDDVWLPHKIECCINVMQHKEKENPHVPIIVNTDLKVVDQNLNIIDDSFWHYEGVNTSFIKDYIDNAAVNSVTGCTMLFNHKAKNVMCKPYSRALMHDAWITLSVYAVGGTVLYLPEQTVLYRQHTGNVLGARDIKRNTIAFRIKNFYSIIMSNVGHYKQMNAIKKISIMDYINAKIRYRKTI
jgi:glycosyltransferase involved in cell wall biosynthesis